MPRSKRRFGINGLNHCIIRGIDKRDIFFDDQDRKKYLKVLIQNKEKYKIKVGTYVLMQNHVHLIIQGNDENISKFFQSMLISYSVYFNTKYERTGHLFQNRYKNKIIDNQGYLKNVVKYIHFNPEKAGICKAVQYKWSGLQEIMKDKTWLDKDIILLNYDEENDKAIELLKKQHSFELNDYYEKYAEYELTEKLSDEYVKKIIEDKSLKYLDVDHIKWNDIYMNKIIKELIGVRGVSINQISRVTGIDRRRLNMLKNK